MPADVTGRKLTIADLRPIERIPAAKPFRIGEARPLAAPRPAVRPAAPKPPPRAAKAATPAPRPDAGPVKAAPPPKPPAKRAPVVLPPPPADWVPPPVPSRVERDADGFPCGWCFESRSWLFHCTLWRLHGLRLEFGEFSGIRRQCRRPDGGGEKLARIVWRVTLQGKRVVVALKGGWEPFLVLADDAWVEWVRRGDERWAERRRALVAAAAVVAEPEPPP